MSPPPPLGRRTIDPSQFSASGDISLEGGADGLRARDTATVGFFARITSNAGNASYGFARIDDGNASFPDGNFTGGSFTGNGTDVPAREVNGCTAVPVGHKVWLEPAQHGFGYVFRYGPGGDGNSGGCATVASLGWGWVAGLETANHCFEATITAGNASGRSACIGNQTIRLSWDNGNSAWRSGTGANMAYCCGNAPLQLRIANGQPVLSLVGNGNACNNTTLSNYTFSFAGAGASSCVTGDADTLWFSGGGRTLANSALMTQIPGSLPAKPTAYLNTFTVKLELMACPAVTCCSNVTLPPTMYASVTGTVGGFDGNLTLTFYADGGYRGWFSTFTNGGTEYLAFVRCTGFANSFSFFILGGWTPGELAPQIAAGNLGSYIDLATGFYTARSTAGANVTTCLPFLWTASIQFPNVGNVTVTE